MSDWPTKTLPHLVKGDEGAARVRLQPREQLAEVGGGRDWRVDLARPALAQPVVGDKGDSREAWLRRAVLAERARRADLAEVALRVERQVRRGGDPGDRGAAAREVVRRERRDRAALADARAVAEEEACGWSLVQLRV